MEPYHPRRKRNEILDEEEKRAIIVRGIYMTIALSKDDEPYVVTLSYGFDPESSSFYFHCAHEGDKLDWIRSNPRVCATIIEDHGYLPGKCDHDYASLVIRGTMTVVDDLEGKKHGLAVLVRHFEKDPQVVYARLLKDESSYDRATVLKLTVDSMVGKKYVG